MEHGKKMHKGEHEEAMEHAKHMLDKGIGMTEIMEVTNLNVHDVRKANKKLRDNNDM